LSESNKSEQRIDLTESNSYGTNQTAV